MDEALKDAEAGQDTGADLVMSARAHLVRFLAVGVGTMVLDFSTYRTLLALGVVVALAKAVGFVVGTTASYLLNRSWTFQSTVGHSALVGFLTLYGVTLFVNVGVNHLLLSAFGTWTYRIEVAFLCAQVVTSALNFLGMRYFVFARR